MMWFQRMYWTSVIWSINELTIYIFSAYETRIVFSVIQFSLRLFFYSFAIECLWSFRISDEPEPSGGNGISSLEITILNIKLIVLKFNYTNISNKLNQIYFHLSFLFISISRYIWENINISLCYIHYLLSAHIKILFHNYLSTNSSLWNLNRHK